MHADRGHCRRDDAVYQTLIDIASAVSTTFDLSELFREIHRALGRIIDVANFYIGILDRGTNTISFPFFQDEKDSFFDPIYQYFENNSLSGELIYGRRPLLLRAADLRLRAEEGRIVGTTPQIWLGVPLMVKNEVIGLMAVQNYTNPDKFDVDDLEILTLISHQIAIAIERKTADDARRLSEEKFRGFVEGTDDLVVQMDREGAISYCNHSVARILGQEPQACIGEVIFDFVHPEDVNAFLDIFMQILSRRRTNISVENRLVNRRTGDAISLHWTINGQYDFRGQSVVVNGIARDLSSRKLAEEERLKAQKLESIGVLTGGIAHDFNNLLSVVVGNLDLMQEYGMIGERGLEYLGNARQACQRANELTLQLISFSQGAPPRLVAANLGELVALCVEKTRQRVEARIDLDIAADLWPVRCDAFQISHAVDSLLDNAIEAVSGGGSVRVRLCNGHQDKALSFVGEGFPLRQGRSVMLEIADSGIGIPREHHSRIFDPYFSTKTRGKQKGMGLGLSTAYAIIRRHQGEIRIWSEPGSGTNVRVFIPAQQPFIFPV